MHRNISFVKYCSERLSVSLITGLPKIANTTNCGRKSFKLIVFFMSIAGFLWQSYTFVEIYFEYPVVQHVTTEDPEVISAPAVTLCNKNRLKRTLFCQALPYECSSKYVLLFINSIICKPPNYEHCYELSPTDIGSMLPSSDSVYFYNKSIELLEALGPQSQLDLIEKCTIERSAQSITCNDSIMTQVPYEGFPYKCFTFSSLIGDPNKDPENISLSDYYSFRLNLHPEEYSREAGYKGAVYVSVHDSRSLKNPFAEQIALQAGYSYRIYVTMTHNQNMPSPYETNCTDYIDLWKKNGGRGPLSKKDCIYFCMIDRMMEVLGCVLSTIDYPHNFPICRTKNAELEILIIDCENECHEGCEVTEYSVTYEIIDNLNHKLCNETDELCRLSYVDLEISFNRLTLERLKSEPLFTSEDLFSHIGGYMGLWLGISFITLFDLAEMLVDIIVHPLIKWRRMSTRIVSFPDDKHNA